MALLTISNHNMILYFILLFFSCFSKIKYPYFSYPTSIALKNKEIFVIHETGITICDSTFRHIVKSVYNFTSEEQISNEDKLSKVSIKKFNDGYIVSIIIDKIYIFDEEGNFKERSESLISSIDDENIFITLTAYENENEYYYFLFGYIYQQSLYLYYYEYDSSKTTGSGFSEIAKLENYYETGYNSYRILNKGISCEFLKYSYSYDFIVCGYFIYNGYYTLSLAHFRINGNSIYLYVNPVHLHWDDWIDEIEFIKSSVTTNRYSGIYCFLISDGEMFCVVYDYYNNYKMSYLYNVDCFTKYYGLKIDYYEEIEEFAVSCLANIGGIQVGTFSKDLRSAAPDEIFKYGECEYIYGHSLIYYALKNDYYVISDVKCNNAK